MTTITQWTGDVHQGDATETLAEMPADSVHCIMTSPPYFGLRDYGVDGQIGLEDSLDEYITDLLEVAEELRRVLRDDGSWWLNLGDSFAGSWGAQSKDETENNLAQHDHPEKNPARNGQMRRKNKMLVPHRVAIALQDAGWIVRSDAVWAKPNPMPHPVKDRLHEHKEFLFHLTPEPDYWFDLDAIREPHKEASLDRSQSSFESAGSGSLACPREDTRESVIMDAEDTLHPNGKNPGDVLEISVKAFPEAHFAVYPPELVETPLKATAPEHVCAECGTPYEQEREVVDREVAGGVSPIPEDERGYSDRQGQSQNDRDGLTQPTAVNLSDWQSACDCDTDKTERGVVLDPFSGAGTTCLVAKRLGRRFVGIELNPEYIAIAQKRVGLSVDEPERLLEDGEAPITAFTDGGDSGAE